MAANQITWNREPGELARQQALPGVLRQMEIVVPANAVALLWRDATLIKTLASGRHALASYVGGLWGSDHARWAVSWVDCSGIAHAFVFAQVRGCDNVPVETRLTLCCHIQMPSLFVLAMLHEREVCCQHDFKARLFDELRNAVADWLADKTIGSLTESRSHKDDMEGFLRRHLYHSWERMGIALQRVEAVSFHNPDVEALRDFSVLSTLQTVQQNSEFSTQRQSMQRAHALSLLQLEQQQQLVRIRQEFAHTTASAGQQQELALAEQKLLADIRTQEQLTEAEEKIKDRRLHGHLGRQKYQVTAQAEIAAVVSETQKNRAVSAIKIAEQQADLDFYKAQLQIRIEQMRRDLQPKNKGAVKK